MEYLCRKWPAAPFHGCVFSYRKASDGREVHQTVFVECLQFTENRPDNVFVNRFEGFNFFVVPAFV